MCKANANFKQQRGTRQAHLGDLPGVHIRLRGIPRVSLLSTGKTLLQIGNLTLFFINSILLDSSDSRKNTELLRGLQTREGFGVLAFKRLS